MDFTEFDRFFDDGGYQDGDEPQAFADWLAGKTGSRVVGLSEDGAVQADPRRFGTADQRERNARGESPG